MTFYCLCLCLTEQRSSIGLQWSSKSWSFKTAITNSHQLGIRACLSKTLLIVVLRIISIFFETRVLGFVPALSSLWPTVQRAKPKSKNSKQHPTFFEPDTWPWASVKYISKTVLYLLVLIYVSLWWGTWLIPGVSNSWQSPFHTFCSSSHCTFGKGGKPC